LAGELGFEPRQTESESVVLPLHHSPKRQQNQYINGVACSSAGRIFDPARGETFYSFTARLGKHETMQL
jgi:hypothetical protein